MNSKPPPLGGVGDRVVLPVRVAVVWGIHCVQCLLKAARARPTVRAVGCAPYAELELFDVSRVCFQARERSFYGQRHLDRIGDGKERLILERFRSAVPE